MTDRFWRPGDRETPAPARPAAGPQPPVYRHRLLFLHLLETHRTLLVTAPTGSGKTTQLPQYLADAGWSTRGRAIAVVLPTRVAVLAATARVAQDRGIPPEEIGASAVGYILPVQARRSPDTAIVYCTPAALLAAVRKDPTLDAFSVVMVDDAHERPVAADVMFAVLRVIQSRRGNLRLVIASASLSGAADFVDFYGGPAAVARLRIEGISYPVRVVYARQAVRDYLDAAFDIIKAGYTHWRATGRQSGSDVLVFVPGVEQVHRLCEAIAEWTAAPATPDDDLSRDAKRQRSAAGGGRVGVAGSGVGSKPVHALPLHASLPPKHQLDALEVPPSGTLKVVVATPVAQSSLTLSSISIVIDCGFENIRTSSPGNANTFYYATVPASKASALQRAGRAGRTRPGVCFRLYTRHHFETMLPAETAPEILNGDLAEATLALHSVGVRDLSVFSFIVPPPRDALASALGRLHALGALALNGERTALGVRLSAIPLPPPLARAFLEGERRGVGRFVACACAMLQVSKSLFTHHTRKCMREVFAAAEGDCVSFVNIFKRWANSGMSPSWSSRHGISQAALVEAHKLARILKQRLRRSAVDFSALAEDAGKSLASRINRSFAVGLFATLSVLTPDGYTYQEVLAPAATAAIHPESVLYGRCPRYVVAAEVSKTSERIWLRHVSVVESVWLVADLPSIFSLP
jgi:ATP-dependent RNA helicase DDX35